MGYLTLSSLRARSSQDAFIPLLKATYRSYHVVLSMEACSKVPATFLNLSLLGFVAVGHPPLASPGVLQYPLFVSHTFINVPPYTSLTSRPSLQFPSRNLIDSVTISRCYDVCLDPRPIIKTIGYKCLGRN